MWGELIAAIWKERAMSLGELPLSLQFPLVLGGGEAWRCQSTGIPKVTNFPMLFDFSVTFCHLIPKISGTARPAAEQGSTP
jgi:hypothetical protein